MKRLVKKITFLLVAACLVVGAVLFLKNFDFNKLFTEKFSFESTNSYNEFPVSVHFLDVGCADCIFIKCQDKSILIDAADKDVNPTVCNYLKRNNIKDLDLVVVTHPHRDHIGQMSEVIDTFDVKRFIMPKLKEDVLPITKTYEKLLKSLRSKNISAEEPVPGTSFKIGDANIDIFAPNAMYDDVNNYSIVLKLTYGKTKFLFTGDAESESEKDMISAGFDLKADVLKVGHHGSKTSTSQEFLNVVKPEYAVISVGESQYNLPKKVVLNRLLKNNIGVLRTDLNGTVVMATDGQKIEVSKEKD